MNSKLKSFAFLFALVTMALFTSCSDDDDDTGVAAPEITSLEVGLENSLVGYIGSDLHIEAEVLADGLIDVMTVELHNEYGTGEDIEAEFTDYAGMRNATLHRHIDIPSDAAPGEYHFHLTVTDQLGNSTSVERDIVLEELIDEEAPKLDITAAPTSGQEFSNGETITISGEVTDNKSLAGMLVALVYESDNIADADVTGGNEKVIVMEHTHDFGDHDHDDHDHGADYDFTVSIDVGAEFDKNMTPEVIEGENAWKSGNYYILARVKDAAGNWVFSDRYPVVINL